MLCRKGLHEIDPDDPWYQKEWVVKRGTPCRDCYNTANTARKKLAYARDPRKAKERSRRYREAHREQTQETVRTYKKEHRNEIKEQSRIYRENNRDKIQERNARRIFVGGMYLGICGFTEKERKDMLDG